MFYFTRSKPEIMANYLQIFCWKKQQGIKKAG